MLAPLLRCPQPPSLLSPPPCFERVLAALGCSLAPSVPEGWRGRVHRVGADQPLSGDRWPSFRMATSGALFPSLVPGSRGSSNKYLVEFRAGKMSLKGTTVTPDKRKGLVYIQQTDDSLIHFCWKDRTSGNVEDVSLPSGRPLAVAASPRGRGWVCGVAAWLRHELF